MLEKMKNENLVNNSNQTQQKNFNARSLEIIKMTLEKKEEIQSLRNEGLMEIGVSNSLVGRCNYILSQQTDEELLMAGRKHIGYVAIDYNWLYRNPKEVSELCNQLSKTKKKDKQTL